MLKLVSCFGMLLEAHAKSIESAIDKATVIYTLTYPLGNMNGWVLLLKQNHFGVRVPEAPRALSLILSILNSSAIF